MTTKTMTAAEAQEFANRLATEERDLAQRKEAARNTAAFETMETSLGAEASALSDAANAAVDAWSTAAADPKVGLDGLFTAWVALRVTSNVRSDHVAHASSRMGAIKPRTAPGSNHQIAYREDTNDTHARDQFMLAVEGAIAARVRAAVNAHRTEQQALVEKAADNAAAAIN